MGVGCGMEWGVKDGSEGWHWGVRDGSGGVTCGTIILALPDD